MAKPQVEAVTKDTKPETVGASLAVQKHNIAQAQRTSRAGRVWKHGGMGGALARPEARAVLAAITQAYGLDPVKGDVQILGGDTVYISAQAYMTRVAKRPRFHSWVKRPATGEEKTAQGYATDDAVWFVELVFFPPENITDMKPFTITSAFGQANEANCQLQNVSKEKGDPRVLNRMAIKRAQHEACRDVEGFSLDGPEMEAAGMPDTETLLAAGIRVVEDDGIINIGDVEAEAEATSADAEAPAEPEPEPEATDDAPDDAPEQAAKPVQESAPDADADANSLFG